ncbi:MAG: hypothetical protein L0216_08975 [Planctomycetales bacterium]|nr:hypothetical protein [Planctomycetales bacterium]
MTAGRASRIAALALVLAAGASRPVGAEEGEAGSGGGLLDLGLRGLDLRLASPDESLEIQFHGILDLEWYGLGHEPSGMVTNDRPFANFRAQLFADVFIGEALTGLVEVRADRGHAPGDHSGDVRLNQAFARLAPPGLPEGASAALQAGMFATPFGNFIPRHDSTRNPLVRRPLPYDHRTTIRFDRVAATARAFSTWKRFPEDEWGGERRGVTRGEPIFWQEVYALGAMAFGGAGPVEGRVAAMNSAPSGSAYSWPDWPAEDRAWSLHGRLGARIEFGTKVGASYAYGTWLPERFMGRKTEQLLGVGGRSHAEFRQQAFGLDLEFARGHLEVFGEAIYTSWEEPIGTPGAIHAETVATLAGYLEAKYKLVFLDPSLFAAARFGRSWNDRIRIETGARVKWDRDQTRFELGIGWALGPETTLKAEYEWNVTHGGRDPKDNAWLAQLAVRF